MTTPDTSTQPAVYTVDEVVALFGGRRRRSAIYEDLRRGAIPSLRLGRRLFIPGSWVEQLRAGTDNGGEQPVSGTPVTRENRGGTRRGT
jgi:hypothetical protein